MEVQELLAQHKTIKSFAKDNSILKYPERYRSQIDCINACSPTLNDLQVAYGSNMKLWMQEQINLLETIVGVREKLLAHQIVMLIEIFLSNGNVKATMLLNFFHRLVSGQYGRFYGNMDIMQIGEAWQKYITSSNEIYKDQIARRKEEERLKYEQELEKQRLLEQENAITFEEFRKQQKIESGIDVPSLKELIGNIVKEA